MGITFLILALGSALVFGPGLVSAFVAHHKGYRPWFWILSGGLLGMLVTVLIPGLAQAATPEQRERWESRADWTGGLLTGFTFLFMLAFPALAMLVFVGAWSSAPVMINAPVPNPPPPPPFLREERAMTTIETPEVTPQSEPTQPTE